MPRSRLPKLLELRSRARIRRRRYTRFYGRFEALSGQVKGYEFQVKINERVSNKALSKLIAHTYGKIAYENSLPVHRKGESFSSFRGLFGSKWVRIRRLLDYDIQVQS